MIKFFTFACIALLSCQVFACDECDQLYQIRLEHESAVSRYNASEQIASTICDTKAGVVSLANQALEDAEAAEAAAFMAYYNYQNDPLFVQAEYEQLYAAYQDARDDTYDAEQSVGAAEQRLYQAQVRLFRMNESKFQAQEKSEEAYADYVNCCLENFCPIEF